MFQYWWKHERHVKIDKLWMSIAWMLPKTLVKWAFVRLTAHATTGQYEKTNTSELTVIEALNRWSVK